MRTLPLSSPPNGGSRRAVSAIAELLVAYGTASSVCHSASAYQISPGSDHPRHSYDIIAIFSMVAVICSRVIVDQPQIVIVGLALILKFLLNRIYSFGVSLFLFWRFGLKLHSRG